MPKTSKKTTAESIKTAKRKISAKTIKTVVSEPVTAEHKTKKTLVAGLLSRAEGASIDEIITMTGWLPHSTRAALTGFRKAGREIARTKDDVGVTRYRFASAAL